MSRFEDWCLARELGKVTYSNYREEISYLMPLIIKDSITNKDVALGCC